MLKIFTCTLFLLLLLLPANSSPQQQDSDAPVVLDDRLVIEKYAASPDIVHPVACEFDKSGRLLVVESHTHFPPPNYAGPKGDRVKVVADTNGDGKADSFTTYFEGTTHTMDLALAPDDSIYMAMRNEILRLTDTNNQGIADKKERIAFLDTKGNYPHNGLSGLCFDTKGNLFFGMGENLNAPFTLKAADGSQYKAEYDGGFIYKCSAKGEKLHRHAYGFWNPFGIGQDVYGRTFCVDNDPDGMPPCRMVHVIPQGDYGYQYRYGREGKHPFQAWQGQLAGTLPFMSGTGEAPCKVIAYESDGLPQEYLGQLFVTSWADHRVERYVVTRQGSSFVAVRKPFVKGGSNFRPAGMCIAPDGSIFITDWVKPDYQLHGQGAVWHIRSKNPTKPNRPTDAAQAAKSLHRPLREAAARKLLADAKGVATLRELAKDNNLRVKATALLTLANHPDPGIDWVSIARNDPSEDIKLIAVRHLAEQGKAAFDWNDAKLTAALKREMLPALKSPSDLPQLKAFLKEDAFLTRAAIVQLSLHPVLLAASNWTQEKDDKVRTGLFLAIRHSNWEKRFEQITRALADDNEEIRLLASKWISDDRLKEFEPMMKAALESDKNSVRMVKVYSTAIASINGEELNETKLGEYFLKRLNNPSTSLPQKISLLKQVPSTHPGMKLNLLTKLFQDPSLELKLEVIRALGDHPDAKKNDVLFDIVMNDSYPELLRAEAISQLSTVSKIRQEYLINLALSKNNYLAEEALRSLTGFKFTEQDAKQFIAMGEGDGRWEPLFNRIVGQPFYSKRPAIEDTQGWLKLLQSKPGIAEAGRRIFAQKQLATCSKCHRIDGRGAVVGPELSDIGKTEPRHLIESILRPSTLVAPHYQVWQIETKQGKELTGMLVSTNLDEEGYLDAQGNIFKLKTQTIAEIRAINKSIMPEGLLDTLTDQEIRDLLAYLQSRK